MILPIVAFGTPILRKKCTPVSTEYPNLDILICNMWDTMYAASGVGLAAPQINRSIRLFIIDTNPFLDDDESDLKPLKQVFINPRIVQENGVVWGFNEGCLSIPDIREDVSRKSSITIEYFDEEFKMHTDVFDGLTARVIQHEYDHINGVLFIDKLSPLRKRMIRGKLLDISKGKITANYKMRFFK